MSTARAAGRKSDGPRPPGAPASLRRRLQRSLAFVAAALVLWKLRFLVAALLFKLRFLVVGLGQVSALFGTLLALGDDLQRFGWTLVLEGCGALYLRGLGELAALRWFRVPLTPAMFVPGLGRLVRLGGRAPRTHAEDARAALAGPLCGTVVAASFLLAGRHAGWPSLVAAARLSAWLNLFLLLPVGRFDGSRALVLLGRAHRIALGLVALGAWLAVHEGLLLAFMAVVFFRAWREGLTAGPKETGGHATAGLRLRAVRDPWALAVTLTLAALLASLALLLAAGGAGKL